MMRKCSFYLIITINLVFACLGAAWGLTFSSNFGSIKINGRPGQVANRNFKLTLAKSELQTHFKCHIEDWWHSEDGMQSFYREPGSQGNPLRSCAKWLKINPVETAVEPGGTLDVRITVSIPSDVKPGGYWCVLTVDELPDPLKLEPEIGMRCLASISTGIFVYIQPLDRVAKIMEVNVLPDKVTVKIRNEGNTPLGVEGSFEFVHPGEKIPVAKVVICRQTLLPEPVNTIACTSKLPDEKTLPSGRYLVRTILDIGLDHYIGVQKEMEIKREVGKTSSDK